MSDGPIVPPYGPQPSLVLLVGEAPGREEFARGRPFVGKSGHEQSSYLARYGVSTSTWRMANVCWEYIEGNPDPTPALISKWTPHLEAEVRRTKPKVIAAVGSFAMRWFLGQDADMTTCRGLPHDGGAFDPSIAHRACGAIVVPTIHPAAGFYEGDARAPIDDGYRRLAEIIKALRRGETVTPRRDEYAGREDYRDVTGAQAARELRAQLKHASSLILGFDTEGVPGRRYSVQYSLAPGTGRLLRVTQPDFSLGIAALQQLANSGTTFVTHDASTPQGCMYDMAAAREMGLELKRARVWNSMYAAYLMRLEPLGAKALGWRWFAMRMRDFEDLVGPYVQQRRLDYFDQVLQHQWPPPEQRLEIDNAGQAKLKKPKSIESRVTKFLVDAYAKGKDCGEMWKGMDPVLAAEVEAKLGPFPDIRIEDAPLDEIIPYACSDADFCLRAYHTFRAEHARLDMTELMDESIGVLPAFDLMQRTGLPASRSKFVALRSKLQREINRLNYHISVEYNDGQPINPKSPDQIIALMEKRGVKAAEFTEGGKPSTGKKSIEHLRTLDKAMAAVADWRERQHVRDMYCAPMLALIPSDSDVYFVRPNLKTCGTTTRRLATTDPSLLSFPKHDKPGGNDYGKQIRNCFEAGEGQVFVEVDLSQVEARILAHESADPILCQLFIDGRDIHRETAAKMFKVSLDEVTDLQRFLSKKITFGGIMYGQTGMGLATQLRMMNLSGWSAERCDALKTDWMKLHKVAAEYIRWAEDDAAKTGMVRDRWGMLRYLPAVWSGERKLVAEAKRQAVNHRIQGGAQGLLRQGLAWLYPRILDMQDEGLDVQLCLTIHDSLLFLCADELVEPVVALAKEALTKHNGMEMRVPCVADAKWGKTWGKL